MKTIPSNFLWKMLLWLLLVVSPAVARGAGAASAQKDDSPPDDKIVEMDKLIVSAARYHWRYAKSEHFEILSDYPDEDFVTSVVQMAEMHIKPYEKILSTYCSHRELQAKLIVDEYTGYSSEQNGFERFFTAIGETGWNNIFHSANNPEQIILVCNIPSQYINSSIFLETERKRYADNLWEDYYRIYLTGKQKFIRVTKNNVRIPKIPKMAWTDATRSQSARIISDWFFLNNRPDIGRKTLDLAKTDAPYVLNDLEFCAALGLSEMRYGDKATALSLLEKAASAKIARPQVYRSLSRLYLENILAAKGKDYNYKLDSAEEQKVVLDPLIAALKLSPSSPQTYAQIFELARHTNESLPKELWKTIVDNCIQQLPDTFDMLNQLAPLLLKSGLKDEVSRLLEAAEKCLLTADEQRQLERLKAMVGGQKIDASYVPNDPDLCATLGLSEMQYGDKATALPLLEKAASAKIRRPEVYRSLSQLYLEAILATKGKDYKLDETEVQKVFDPLFAELQLSHNDNLYHHGTAQTYLQIFELARHTNVPFPKELWETIATNCVRVFPDNFELFYQLVPLLMQNGLKDAAIRLLRVREQRPLTPDMLPKFERLRTMVLGQNSAS